MIIRFALLGYVNGAKNKKKYGEGVSQMLYYLLPFCGWVVLPVIAVGTVFAVVAAGASRISKKEAK